MLYATFTDFVERKCERLGLALLKVNPACASIIGRAKYARRLGVSVHHAVALVIGRRGQKRPKRWSGEPFEVPLGIRH